MKIEIWSDFVCPFCYIGKRRLELALEQFPNKENVTIEYKSYELDPNAAIHPGKSIHELLARKYGVSMEKAKQMNLNVGKQAEAVGLTYHFDTMKHTNTFDAHRVAKFAAKQGKGNEMIERLLKAYFTDSEHIGEHETLISLAGEVGLNTEDVKILLQSCKYTKDVREDEEQARQIGIEGVPFFVFNEEYAVSGAQPPEVFGEVLAKIWEESRKRKTVKVFPSKTAKTSFCTDEGCHIEETN